MVKGPEQLAELGRGGVETALKFANLAMESAEKMMRLQFEAARTFVAEQTENAKALGEAKDPEGMMAPRNRLTEQAVERAMGYSRNVYDIAAAEQEIMGGTLIEYSGLPLAVFKLTKAVLLYTMPLLLVALYLGKDTTLLFVSLKFVALLVGIILIKNTNPRLRIDQSMRFFWGPVTLLAFVAVLLAILGI